MTKPFKLMAAALAAALTGAAAQAHHSFAMFDKTAETVKTGTIVRWQFNNPHSWLYVNVENADGSTTMWSLEGSSPTALIQRGITGDTFKPGTTIQVLVCPLRTGRPGGGIGWAKLADGSWVDPSDGGCNGSVKNQKRWQAWLKKGYTSEKEAKKAESGAG
jgi:hypothetical protein